MTPLDTLDDRRLARAAPAAAIVDTGLLSQVLSGLAAPQKSLPTQLLYDERGALLFDAISRLPEYYLTRTELDILRTNAADIASFIGPRSIVVEPGAGSGRKIRILMQALSRPVAYIPVDIAAESLTRGAAELRKEFPQLDVLPQCTDFTQAMHMPLSAALLNGRRTLFFPGSTIGNFEPAVAQRLLAGWRRMVGAGGCFVIGFDLWKDPAVLHAAYDDNAGVTAQFNLNLLHRLNREFGADFNLRAFAHHAYVNRWLRRVEMHLVSLKRQRVRVAGHEFNLMPGETIHTENSYKYTSPGFTQLACEAGWVLRERWTDTGQLYNIHGYEADGA